MPRGLLFLEIAVATLEIARLLGFGRSRASCAQGETRVNGKENFWRFMGLFWQVIAKNGIERLHVRDHASVVWSTPPEPAPDSRTSAPSVRFPQDRVSHQLDLRSHLPGTAYLALKPVGRAICIWLSLLDEIAIDRNAGSHAAIRNTQPRGIDRLPSTSRKTVLGRVDIAALRCDCQYPTL